MSSKTENDGNINSLSCINSNTMVDSQHEITVEDIVRDRTILDRIDVIPNPFESQKNTRINYPSFEEMFRSNKSSAVSPYPTTSKNSSLCSGSFNKSSHNDSSTHFRWSIDQIARLLPAEIEYRLQDDTLTIFKPHDEETQHKIDEYFNTTILPSPYTPDSKKISPTSIASKLEEFFAEPSPTDLYISHGTNGKFLNNKNFYNVVESTNLNQPTNSDFNSTRNLTNSSHKNSHVKTFTHISCQTDISINPDIDISKFLGDMFMLRQENCRILSSNSKLSESNASSKIASNVSHDLTYNCDNTFTSNSKINFSNKDEFHDIKNIQNSTANDFLLDGFNQLKLFSNDSTVYHASNDNNHLKRKNLHVTFKDEIDTAHSYTSAHSKSYHATLPNPLKNINHSNVVETTDHFCLKTPPYTVDILDDSLSYHQDTPYLSNGKSYYQNHTSILSSIKKKDLQSSFVDGNEHSFNFNDRNLYSNISSPSWHQTSYFNSPTHYNQIKKGSPLADLDELDKCFGSLDTSPIKPYYAFNSTATEMVIANNHSNIEHKGVNQFSDKSGMVESDLTSQRSRDHSIIESGYSSNTTSVTTSSIHTFKNNQINISKNNRINDGCHEN